MTIEEIEGMLKAHERVLVKRFNDQVTHQLLQRHDPYVCFYHAYYNLAKDTMVYKPWACMPVTKWDSAFFDGELNDLDMYETIARAKEWGRKHLGAKFPNDENIDGTNVLSFNSPNSSANCYIQLEPLPFLSTKLDE